MAALLTFGAIGMLLVLVAVGILIFVAAFTLIERKLMALLQRREGPDRVGFEGLGQPFADGLKLLRKETLRPKDGPEGRLFLLAPMLSLWVSLTLWAFVPFSAVGALSGGEVGLPLLLGLGSLGSYGVIYAGWSSNSKYALLGAFRAVAQFVSYEVLFSLLFLPPVAAAASLNPVALVWFQAEEGWFAHLLPLWLLALPVVLAEANRTPFDLPEAEAELVAGFNVEYSSLLFAFFFLAEYSGMGFFAALLATLFFGGWSALPWGLHSPPIRIPAGGWPAPRLPGKLNHVHQEGEVLYYLESIWRDIYRLRGVGDALGGVLVLSLKIQLLCALFILVRAALPRLRFDQLLQLCWKLLFPLVAALVLALVGLGYGALQLELGRPLVAALPLLPVVGSAELLRGLRRAWWSVGSVLRVWAILPPTAGFWPLLGGLAPLLALVLALALAPLPALALAPVLASVLAPVAEAAATAVATAAPVVAEAAATAVATAAPVVAEAAATAAATAAPVVAEAAATAAATPKPVAPFLSTDPATLRRLWGGGFAQFITDKPWPIDPHRFAHVPSSPPRVFEFTDMSKPRLMVEGTYSGLVGQQIPQPVGPVTNLWIERVLAREPFGHCGGGSLVGQAAATPLADWVNVQRAMEKAWDLSGQRVSRPTIRVSNLWIEGVLAREAFGHWGGGKASVSVAEWLSTHPATPTYTSSTQQLSGSAEGHCASRVTFNPTVEVRFYDPAAPVSPSLPSPNHPSH
jgi:NADH:ubiquinone oxidoreductase subunit H